MVVRLFMWDCMPVEVSIFVYVVHYRGQKIMLCIASFTYSYIMYIDFCLWQKMCGEWGVGA